MTELIAPEKTKGKDKKTKTKKAPLVSELQLCENRD